MDVFTDNRITDIAVRCSGPIQQNPNGPESGVLRHCRRPPAPALWVMAAKDEVRPVRARPRQTYFRELPPGCRPSSATPKLPNTTSWGCPSTSWALVPPSKLQSKPIRWLFLDEVRNYPPGALEMVLKRTRAFWNSRRLIISTPAMKDDAVDRAFKAGDQRIYHVCCPKCGHPQPLNFDQLKWDKSDLTKPGGKWNFDTLAEDDPLRVRQQGMRPRHSGHPGGTQGAGAGAGTLFAPTPMPPGIGFSFHWNALLPPWVSWRSVVEEFIAARGAARTGRPGAATHLHQ